MMESERISVRVVSTASRVLLVFVTYALLLVATAGLVSTAGLVAVPATPRPGPESIPGLPIVALASAGLLSWVVLRSHWSGGKLALGLAAAFFCAHTVLPELDARMAPGSFSRPEDGAAGSWFGGAVFAATFAATAVALLGRRRADGERPLELARAASILASTLKFALAAALQAITYALLGCRLGWYPAGQLPLRGPVDLLCRGVASSGTTVAPVAGWPELLRGSIWALVGLILVRLLRRGPAETSLAVGLFFALAGPVHQLLPSPLVPGAWAAGEQMALATSQLVCGAALALWYSWDGPAPLVRRLADSKTSTSRDSASRGQRGAGGLPG
jgi:hypothetical protein